MSLLEPSPRTSFLQQATSAVFFLAIPTTLYLLWPQYSHVFAVNPMDASLNQDWLMSPVSEKLSAFSSSFEEFMTAQNNLNNWSMYPGRYMPVVPVLPSPY